MFRRTGATRTALSACPCGFCTRGRLGESRGRRRILRGRLRRRCGGRCIGWRPWSGGRTGSNGRLLHSSRDAGAKPAVFLLGDLAALVHAAKVGQFLGGVGGLRRLLPPAIHEPDDECPDKKGESEPGGAPDDFRLSKRILVGSTRLGEQRHSPHVDSPEPGESPPHAQFTQSEKCWKEPGRRRDAIGPYRSTRTHGRTGAARNKVASRGRPGRGKWGK